ncbi:energy transducer TonB [Hymenobacter ruricola]|uniref:TonB family protein n=1 Tax=Hymenobacter ruricola TaxID=2791023 RepID=A0ABS0HZ47_9BACT|nr:energy transducer TonB [Hymenobacter ruricola]MBF9219975.1 TonB family protein [Hymenobacter ruricola]
MLFISTVVALQLMVAGGPQLTQLKGARPATAAEAPAVPTVTGRVLTDQEEPLPGVVVSVQGASHVTSTNASGNFLLTLSDVKSVLVFKCEGYRDQALAVSGTAPLTVKMYALSKAAPAGAASPETTAEVTGKPKVLSYSEVLPTFPGGDAAYGRYLSQNAHFPEEALAKGISGTVFVSFVVDEEGRILDAEVVRGAGHGFDQEALRVIRLMPWWNPGRVAGDAVRVSRTLAVPFVVRERP